MKPVSTSVASTDNDKRFRLFYENSPIAYHSLDSEGRFIEINPAWLQMLGYTREEVIGKWAGDFLAPGQVELFKQRFPRFKEIGEIHKVPFDFIRKDGAIVSTEVDGRIAYDEDGAFLHTHCVLHDVTVRKRAEQMSEALRAKERQYRDLFELASDALLLISTAQGKILDANQMATELYGYKWEELIGNDSIMLSAEPDESARRLQEALNNPGQLITIPLRLHRKKDGTVFPVEITARSFLQEGNPVLLVACRDITERKRVEAELKAEKVNSESMFESSPIALFVLDDQCNIVRVNGRAVDMFGGKALAALQHRPGNALGCIHSSEDPRGCGYSPSCPLCPVRNGLQSLLSHGGEMQEVDLAMDLIRDGSPQKVWMEIGAKFIQINGRKHVCVAMVDITSRKRTEAALEKQNSLFTTLLNNLQIGVFMVEVPSGKPLLANEASYRILGRGIMPQAHASRISEVYAVYKSGTNQLYPNDELPLVLAMRGISKHADDMYILKPDGTQVEVEVFGSPIKDSQGNIWASLVSFQDITERKRATEAALQLTNTKNKFISVVSHELRSPLATIKEATSLVREEILGTLNDEQKDMLEVAKVNIDRLGRLIQNVLTYQKIDAGKMLYDFLEHDVNEILQEVYRNIILANSERKNDVVLNPAGKPPRIRCDKDRLMQVLLNLISNAIKYSEHGPIIIETRLKPKEILFSVRDSGQGIEAAELENIFLPFSHGRGRKTGGTGLGLAISKEIVLAHHGKIWAESEKGKGSTFYFTLPL